MNEKRNIVPISVMYENLFAFLQRLQCGSLDLAILDIVCCGNDTVGMVSKIPQWNQCWIRLSAGCWHILSFVIYGGRYFSGYRILSGHYGRYSPTAIRRKREKWKQTSNDQLKCNNNINIIGFIHRPSAANCLVKSRKFFGLFFCHINVIYLIFAIKPANVPLSKTQANEKEIECCWHELNKIVKLVNMNIDCLVLGVCYVYYCDKRAHRIYSTISTAIFAVASRVNRYYYKRSFQISLSRVKRFWFHTFLIFFLFILSCWWTKCCKTKALIPQWKSDIMCIYK